MHADTAGTKTSLAYLYWRETGDISVWEGIVQDALVMNLDDMACSGLVDNFVISSTIGRNKHHIPGEVLSVLINGAQKFAEKMADNGVNLYMAGGETADVGDIVRTADVGYTAFGRMKRTDVLDIKIQEGDYIVGLAGYGQARYESEYNSGIGCNGLTSARHDVLHHSYAEAYPETFNPNIPQNLVYTGSKMLSDAFTLSGGSTTVGKLLLSPTRTFLPVLKQVFAELNSHLHGIIHNTGGGQYKVEKFIPSDLTAYKDNLLSVPPVFHLISEESGVAMADMPQVYNMGTRLEVYTGDKSAADQIIAIAQSFNIEAQIIGRVVKDMGKRVVLK
jgi:phosphoribosylformylglycinamidine cyclo-ligase